MHAGILKGGFSAMRSLSMLLIFCNRRQHSFLVSGSSNEPLAATIRATVELRSRVFSSSMTWDMVAVPPRGDDMATLGVACSSCWGAGARASVEAWEYLFRWRCGGARAFRRSPAAGSFCKVLRAHGAPGAVSRPVCGATPWQDAERQGNFARGVRREFSCVF